MPGGGAAAPWGSWRRRCAEGHRSPVHVEAEVFDLMTRLCDGFEGRDAWLRRWMEVSVDQGYAKLDALLAAGEIAGPAEGAEA